MNKVVTIISSVLIVALSVVVIFVAISNQKDKYAEKAAKISQDTAVVEEEIRSIKQAKDENGYLPSDAVVYFIDEVRNSSPDKAKLYITADNKDKDPQAWVGVTSQDINLTDIIYNLNGPNAIVTGTLSESENQTSLEFRLIKEDGNWKITEIKGE